MKKHFTKRYVRYRVRSPSLFKRTIFRTQDIGRKGHSKRIAGILKKTGTWATQAMLVTKKDYRNGVRVKKKYGRTIIYKK